MLQTRKLSDLESHQFDFVRMRLLAKLSAKGCRVYDQCKPYPSADEVANIVASSIFSEGNKYPKRYHLTNSAFSNLIETEKAHFILTHNSPQTIGFNIFFEGFKFTINCPPMSINIKVNMSLITLGQATNQPQGESILDIMKKTSHISFSTITFPRDKTVERTQLELYERFPTIQNSHTKAVSSCKGVIHIFTGIASTLQDLHKKEIAHGKIKPANIMVKDEGDGVLGLIVPSRSVKTTAEDLKRFGKYFFQFYYHINCQEMKSNLKNAKVIDWKVNNYRDYCIKNLILKLLSEDPAQRGTASELYDTLKEIDEKKKCAAIWEAVNNQILSCQFKKGKLEICPAKSISEYFFTGQLDDSVVGNQIIHKFAGFICLLETNYLLGEGSAKKVFDGAIIQINPDELSINLTQVAIGRSKRSNKITLCRNENLIAAKFSSRHVVKPYMYSFTIEQNSESIFIMVMEQFELITNSEDFKKLPLKDKIHVLIGAAEGTSHIHSEGYIHRDIKPRNIGVRKLLNNNIPTYEGVVFDLGFTQKLSEIKKIFGTLPFFSPELFGGPYETDKQNKAVEMWAWGITLYKIFHPHNWYPPFLRDVEKDELAKTFSKLYDDSGYESSLFDWNFTNYFESRLQELIKELLSLDPSKRPSAADLARALTDLKELCKD